MTTEPMSLAERLKHAMELGGMTSQSGLARAVGVKPQAIQYLLDPKNNATGSKHLSQIAAALEVDATWLATGIGDARPSHLVRTSAPNIEPKLDAKGHGLPWPFAIARERLDVLQAPDLERINLYMTAVVETREADVLKSRTRTAA